MAVWIYGFVEPSVGYGSDAASVVGAVAVAALHLATGFAIARGWAPLLVVAVPLLAYPAGYADRGELIIWQGLAFRVPVGALLIFAGVSLRFMLTMRRGPAPAGPRVARSC